MIDKNFIKEQFKKHKISQMQLDPYGFCNAKCWFCPVKYRGNPDSGKETMSVELLEKIINDIMGERRADGLVNLNFGGFYTAHYNEILLYKHFEDLLKICKKHNLCFMVLSNGVPLTPEKVDLIVEYSGVVNGICLNIPAFEPELWSKRSGISISQFDKLIRNINYAREKLPHMVQNKSFSIQINGAHEGSFVERGGWLDKGPDFPADMDLNIQTGELQTQHNLAQSMFPNMQIFSVPSLIDRAGYLDPVMTNKNAVVKYLQKGDVNKQVVGCNNGWEVGGRPVGWIHVNANGQAFLCCNDYDMEVVVGDFKTQSLRDFWGSDHHVDKILESYNTICRNCASARFED